MCQEKEEETVLCVAEHVGRAKSGGEVGQVSLKGVNHKHKIKITLGTPIIKKRTTPDIANNTHTNDGTNTNDGDFSGVWWYWLFFVRRPRDG